MEISTPYYLIDESKLEKNLQIMAHIREISGAKFLLALKCFANWGVFPLMQQYMDGTTSSSLFEARLGREKFGKETHAYSVAFSDSDVEELKSIADKIIFNSVSQLDRFYERVAPIKVGLRINPKISYSHFDLANPARKCSRLGVSDAAAITRALPKISGAMFHYNCENADFENFSALLDTIAQDYGKFLHQFEWVSLGGGFYFTQAGYPHEKFAEKLKSFAQTFNVQVYLEPGEAAVTQTTELVTTVLDIVHNEADIAIVDSSTEAHMLDLLIYAQEAKCSYPTAGPHRYNVAGKTCLAGDIFGTFGFDKPLQVGDRIHFADAAGYTMVKKNWFNGIAMPSIVIKRRDGKHEVLRTFSYNDFVSNLS